MSYDEVLTRTYDVSVDTLWNAVKQTLTTGTRVRLKGVQEEERRAIFTTGMSWTSWGENMVASVEPPPGQPNGAVLKVTGHPHTSMLTSQWGEELHRNVFARNFTKDIERALAV